MKKILSSILAACMILSMFTACSSNQNTPSGSESSSSTAASDSSSSADSTEGFAIYYPSYMQEAEGEKLILEQKPEKIVVLSNSAMQILVRCDVKPIAFRKTPDYIDFPAWVRELPTIETGMNMLDLETVISMDPDLVIMGNHLKKDFGQQLKDANIPVYYTSEGHAIAYPEVKEEAITLARSFGSEEIAAEIAKEFEAVEQRTAEFKKTMEPKKIMILFGAPPTYQQTSMGYLGSILSSLAFENASDSLVDPSTRLAPLDMEKLVEIDPDMIFAMSPTAPTVEDIQKVYQEEFAKNPHIWNSLQAVKNDNVIYLSNEYVTAKGIHVIKSIHNLLDQLEGKLAK